jgi:dihydroorotase
MVPLLMAKVLEKKITLADVIAKTSQNPARILGIPPAGFMPNDRADFALYPKKPEKIAGDHLHSRCGWTPYEGMDAVFPALVIMGGMVVYNEGEFPEGSPKWLPGRGYVPP